MQDHDWLPLISFVVTILVLLTTFVGGYAVLRKRVKDLEDDTSKDLTEDKHESLCKIATLEMKNHVSKSMKDTINEFDEKIFQPSLTKLLNAINGGK